MPKFRKLLLRMLILEKLSCEERKMPESKTAEKSLGKTKQPDKLCPNCGKPIVPVMQMPHRKMVWRHKLELSEKCS
jgi:ribosomal protein L32